MSEHPSGDLQAVRRWTASGGHVQVIDPGPPLVLDLVSCDGHRMQRLTSTSPDLMAELLGTH